MNRIKTKVRYGWYYIFYVRKTDNVLTIKFKNINPKQENQRTIWLNKNETNILRNYLNKKEL